MLPSTGYFKGISCPFYDSGFCERPYCHFRHVKKEIQNATGDGIESGAVLQKLVSAAVQKVLQHTDVERLPHEDPASTNSTVDVSKVNNIPTLVKATYNPTPISELNKTNNPDTDTVDDITDQRKKHIPVPYTPRKPTSCNVTKPAEANGSCKPFVPIPPAKYTPGGTEILQLDPYTPKGSLESNEKYLPGSEVKLQQYTPNDSKNLSKVNYVPSEKNNGKKKFLEYEPTKVSSKHVLTAVTYQPSVKSSVPCFSSDEEEPDTKKRRLSNDLNELDELGPEFDILDQILDEENQAHTEENITQSKDKDRKIEEHTIKKSKLDEKDNKHIKNKIIADKKSHSRSRHEKSKDSERKSHKSSHKAKDKSCEKASEKSGTKKNYSSSRKLDQEQSKPSKSKDEKKHKIYKSNESSSRNSNSSRSGSKDKSKRKLKHHKSSKESKEQHHKDKTKYITISDDESRVSADDDGLRIEDVLFEISESDEETIAQECKKIFEEYVPQEKIARIDNIQTEDMPEEREYIPSKKRISHTSGKDVKVIPRAPLKPNFKVSAAQTMAERLTKIRDYHESKKVSELPTTDSKTLKVNNVIKPASAIVAHSKIRIAHVPYASTLITAKKIIPPVTTIDKPSTSNTTIQSVRKGEQRVAHIPNDKFIDRPGVLEPLASKIAANIRSTYLNMMIDECLKIYLSPTDAYARAQHEELATSKKCSTVQIYKNSAVLTVSRLRKEFQECNGIKKTGSDCATLQKLPQTSSEKNSGSWSIQSKYKRTTDNPHEFVGAKLYNNIKKWVLTDQQLQDNGFPRPHSNCEKGRAIIYTQNKQKPPKGYIRTCCRCKKDYTVDKKNFPTVKQECIYHPNNKYRVRGEAKYQCCSQDSSSDGCCVAPCHVYDYVDFDNLKGFVRTLSPETTMDDYGVYSLDCEMCYTTHGLDLTRITVINSACKVVYETLIRPLHPIIDYNTRYSGITEEQMADVKTTLLEVQATLLTMFNSKTILIGHSLESDFKALKLIHDTVIDTSVVFPHKMGPPYKRALRNLSSEYLKKIIQNSVDGHDSAEDATVCMELVIFKLKEDLKTR